MPDLLHHTVTLDKVDAFVPCVPCSWMWVLTEPLLTQGDLPGHGSQVTHQHT